MTTITIQEAQANLRDLIHALPPGGEVLITEDDRTIARLVLPAEPAAQPPRRSGTMKGTVLYMAPDFDAPLEEFKESME
jgi:antitoxin (DNA-binding transcriptional repressor) of toxin-antitoxin stability system